MQGLDQPATSCSRVGKLALTASEAVSWLKEKKRRTVANSDAA